MIEKISICLFHPKLIGRYVVEKTWKSLVFLLVLIFINVATIFAVVYHETTLSPSDESKIMEAILNDSESNYSFSAGKLEGNSKHFYVDGVEIVFLDEYNPSVNSPLAIVFSADGYETYFYQVRVGKESYSNYNFSSFNFSDGISTSDKLGMLSLIRVGFDPLLPLLGFANSISIIFDFAFMILILFTLMYLFGNSINPNVKGIFRFRLILNVFVSYCFLYWFYLVFNFGLLYYLALVIPYIYYFLAMRNIVKIK